jgi:hypothetical protein
MPKSTENMSLPEAAETCNAAEICITPETDAAEDKPLDAYDAAEAGIMSSSSDEDESDYVPKKRKREADKAAEYDQAEAWVTAVFDDPACKDRVAVPHFPAFANSRQLSLTLANSANSRSLRSPRSPPSSRTGGAPPRRPPASSTASSATAPAAAPSTTRSR